MSAQSTPVGMVFSEAAERRNEMVSQNMERLQHIAWRTMTVRKKNNEQFVLTCIKVDSPWRVLVDELMPNTPESHWQAVRDQGMAPVAVGAASVGICVIAAKRFPDIAAVINEIPAEGVAKCIALDESGCTVYNITPEQQKFSA